MKKWLKRIALVLLIAFAAIQFWRPDRTNPPVDRSRTIQAVMPVPPHVDAILRRSCYDCHSNETVWPWYSNVAPMSWRVADHIHEGREHLNFSNWAAYPPRDAHHLLEETCEEVKERHMPLKDYLFLHPKARLSDADVRALCEWSEQFDERRGRGRGRSSG
jgi:ABC-type nickel/cobalt efflux system permease component RcnA